MKKEKWTCWVDEEKKADGAIVGTKKAVLDWMKKTYPGLRKASDGDMVPAWYFFWENDAEHYQSGKGENLYLVRGPAEEERNAPTSEEEKEIENALKRYRRIHIKQIRERLKAERKDEAKKARRAKVSDDEAADEVAKVILETACLPPREQLEKLEGIAGSDYLCCWSLCNDDMWPISDIVFQMTRAFNGGMDAYIVFRTPKTRRAAIISPTFHVRLGGELFSRRNAA